MAMIVEENYPQPFDRSEAEDEEIPQGVIEAAQGLIEDASDHWRRNSDSIGDELDLNNVGVHFKQLDVSVTNCRQVWLIVLTDDVACTVLTSTIVFEGEAAGDNGLD